MAQKKTLQPCAAASSMLGIISTNAHSMTQPNTPDHSTDDTIPAGTWWAAFTVSSDVCADASYPVIVYTGNSSPSRNAMPMPTVLGHTASEPGPPV